MHGKWGPIGSGGNGQTSLSLICPNETLTHFLLYCIGITRNFNFSYWLHPEKASSFQTVLLHFNLFELFIMERAANTSPHVSLSTEFESVCGFELGLLAQKPNRTAAILNNDGDGYPISHFDSVRLCIVEQAQGGLFSSYLSSPFNMINCRINS